MTVELILDVSALFNVLATNTKDERGFIVYYTAMRRAGHVIHWQIYCGRCCFLGLRCSHHFIGRSPPPPIKQFDASFEPIIQPFSTPPDTHYIVSVEV